MENTIFLQEEKGLRNRLFNSPNHTATLFGNAPSAHRQWPCLLSTKFDYFYFCDIFVVGLKNSSNCLRDSIPVSEASPALTLIF
jgi:hypothetical protein